MARRRQAAGAILIESLSGNLTEEAWRGSFGLKAPGLMESTTGRGNN